MYGSFAVWPLQDALTVWRDGSESSALARVNRNVRLKVLRRDARHYVVRLPDMREGYVDVDGVAAIAGSAHCAMVRRRELPQRVQNDFTRASVLRRFAARLVDTLIFGAVYALLALALFVVAGSAAALVGGLLVAQFGLGPLYEWIGTAAGGTPGKMLLQIQVIDARTGGAPGLGKAALRYLVATLLSGPLVIGFAWALWNNGRTWHDVIAGTWVVRYR
jgi:uncharacterized RDD family membrane protein YckC